MNHLQYIPHQIGNLGNIQHLDLSCNELSEIPTTIMQLEKLKELNLKSNSLLKMPSKESTEIGLKVHCKVSYFEIFKTQIGYFLGVGKSFKMVKKRFDCIFKLMVK